MDLASTIMATHDHWSGHGEGWWPLFPLLWALLIFGFIYFLARRGCGRRGRHGGSGESVLGERYARGEIDEREYRERLDVLKTVRDTRS